MIINPYRLPSATSTVKGGVRASPRTTETLPIVIDTITAMLYVNAVTPETLDATIANLLGSTPELLDTFEEIANAIGEDPNFATTILTALGLTQGQLDNHEGIQQLRDTFNMDNSSLYKEINYVDGDISSIEYWVDETKTTHLFTKSYTLTNGDVSQIVITDHISLKVSTIDLDQSDPTKITMKEVLS